MLHHHFTNFFKRVTTDEPLLRLLYYKPTSGNDDALSPKKPNLHATDVYYKTILKTNFKRAPKANDLTEGGGICRICMYIGASSRTSNLKVYEQNIHFDVLVHIEDFENKDSRSIRIVDRLSELLSEEQISGIGKVKNSRTSEPINAPEGYIGYRNTFTFGTTK